LAPGSSTTAVSTFAPLAASMATTPLESATKMVPSR